MASDNDNNQIKGGKQPGHEVGWGLDKGQKRRNNEDSLATVRVNQASESDSQAVGIYAVADGMGGHQDGAVASKLAVRSAVRQLLEDFNTETADTDEDMPETYQQWLHHAVSVANQVVHQQSEERRTTIGTTLVMAIVVGHQVHIASVGDSRAYLVSASGLRQLTHDHSFVQQLMDIGQITPEEAKTHPYRNVLTQSIGAEAKVTEDQSNEILSDDDYLLLCSDGLFRELDDSQIVNVIRQHNTPQAACEALLEAANKAGGSDNIAVVLVGLKHNGSESG